MRKYVTSKRFRETTFRSTPFIHPKGSYTGSIPHLGMKNVLGVT